MDAKADYEYDITCNIVSIHAPVMDAKAVLH